ncbi:MAG: hypothetical protein AAGB27_15845, partial [Pseudomonadota bacterium]
MLGLASSSLAQGPNFGLLVVSPDVTTSAVAGSGVITTFDEQLLEVDWFTRAINPRPVPAARAVAIDGYDGRELFSTDTITRLPQAGGGEVTVFPSDLFSLSTAGATVVHRVSDFLPEGVNVDAVSFDPVRNIPVVSFDRTVRLRSPFPAKRFAAGEDKGAIPRITVSRNDLVGFDGELFLPFFNAEAAGVPASVNLNAAHVISSSFILMSFDTAVALDGRVFQDHQVVSADGAGGFTPVLDLA